MTSSRDTVREALEKMGATTRGSTWFLKRLNTDVWSIGHIESLTVLFIGECKAYIREKGYASFHSYDADRWDEADFKLEFYKPRCGGGREVHAPTETEAYALAVIAAHGAETREGEG